MHLEIFLDLVYDVQRWSVEIMDHLTDKGYMLEHTFETKDEAINAACLFIKNLI